MHRRLRLRLRSKNEQICIARRVTSYLAGRMTDAQNDRYMLVVLRLKQGENIHRMGRWYQAARLMYTHRSRSRCRIKWLGVAATARRRANRSPIRACISLPRYYTHYTSSWHAFASLHPSCRHVRIQGRARRNSIVPGVASGFFFIPLETHEKYAYRQQKRPFLFIYTQQWLPKARFEKKIEGVYLKIFSTN